MEDKSVINAHPTKDLFITMLVRDLTLKDAIGDLVDNSVDGAKSLRPNKDYTGLEINITAESDHFMIFDNCGGIEVQIARDYAFRFGRPKEKPSSPNSVGQFGIGMKRSLFKLGDSFEVESKANSSQFSLTVNVKEWEKVKDWNFQFDSYEEGMNNDEKSCSTMITVNQLKPDVKRLFSDEKFISDLIKEIEKEHIYSISRGLKITINEKPLESQKLKLKDHPFKTSYRGMSFKDGMNVKIYAGVGDADGEAGGWYIFCNDRLIVGPDQTDLTGWVGGREEGGPMYHQQFNRFRGYVFFEAEDSSILPWNTTKNGMDRESLRFKSVRLKMVEMMKQVIAFLNKMKTEREDPDENKPKPMESLINSTKSIAITELKPKDTERKFGYPEDVFLKPKKREKDTTRISYDISKIAFEEVKDTLGVKTGKEVGIGTFQYFYDMEVE